MVLHDSGRIHGRTCWTYGCCGLLPGQDPLQLTVMKWTPDRPRPAWPAERATARFSSSSTRSDRRCFATRSLRGGARVLIWAVSAPTTRSGPPLRPHRGALPRVRILALSWASWASRSIGKALVPRLEARAGASESDESSYRWASSSQPGTSRVGVRAASSFASRRSVLTSPRRGRSRPIRAHGRHQRPPRASRFGHRARRSQGAS